jgi:hypothetical protein
MNSIRQIGSDTLLYLTVAAAAADIHAKMHNPFHYPEFRPFVTVASTHAVQNTVLGQVYDLPPAWPVSLTIIGSSGLV